MRRKAVVAVTLTLPLILTVVFWTFPMLPSRVNAESGYTDFESGFEGWEPFLHQPVSVVQLSTTYAHSGTHSVEMYGHSYGNDTIGSGGAIKLPITSTSARYELTTWVYVTERSSGNAASFFGFVWENGERVGWNPWGNSSSYVWVRQSEGYQQEYVSYGLTFNRWHQVSVRLDATSGTVSVWLNGTLIVDQWPACNAGEQPAFWDIGCFANYYGTLVMHQYVDDVQVDATSAIMILSPQNKPYATTSIPLTIIVNETTAWMGYSLDGQANVTLTGNTTLTDLLEGAHNVVVYTNTTAGTMWASRTVYFTVDTTLPTVAVLSPENTTYVATIVPLTVTVSEPTSWMGYSLDDQANVTISGNTTLTVLANGLHSVIVYANDTAGNTGASTVFFTVDGLPCAVDIANAVAVFPGFGLFATTEAFNEWRTLPVNITVWNVGTLPVTGNVSGWYSLDNATWLSMGASQPFTLSPGDETLLVFYWNLRAPGVGKSVYCLKFNATASNETLTATDEALIKIKVRLMGDTDGDNDSDVGDARKIQRAMFTSVPEPTYLYWNSFPVFTDMDGDGDVDVGDHRKQALTMFKTWPDP